MFEKKKTKSVKQVDPAYSKAIKRCNIFKRKLPAGALLSLYLAGSVTSALISGCSRNEGTSDSATRENGQESTAGRTTENGESEGDEKESVSVKERKTVQSPTDYVSAEQMALADHWAGSSEAGLAAAMRKCEAGENVTVAVLGGSITQGTISAGGPQVVKKQMYADIFHDWWTSTFPDADIEFINAGIGATDSYLGVHRVQKDVLDHEPDVVLVEFSVNDSDTFARKQSYDNLVRKIALAPSAPAPLLLFMGQTNGASAQNSHAPVGFAYQLPMVSYKNVIEDMMANGIYSAKDLSADEVHPTALGHCITGEILWKYLNSIYENLDSYAEPEAFDFKPVTAELYQNDPRILDSSNFEPEQMNTFATAELFEPFPNDWATESKEQDSNITFRITCRNLGVMYYRRTDSKGAKYDVLIDGEWVCTLDSDFTGGWGNYAETQELLTSKEEAEHVVTFVRYDDGTGDDKCCFGILGLLVS